MSVVQDITIEVSRPIGRGSWGKSLPRFTARNQCYMYGHHRLLTPIELLQVHGWPFPEWRIHSMTGTGLPDLLAESMPLQAVAVPLLAIVLAMWTGCQVCTPSALMLVCWRPAVASSAHSGARALTYLSIACCLQAPPHPVCAAARHPGSPNVCGRLSLLTSATAVCATHRHLMFLLNTRCHPAAQPCSSRPPSCCCRPTSLLLVVIAPADLCSACWASQHALLPPAPDFVQPAVAPP